MNDLKLIAWPTSGGTKGRGWQIALVLLLAACATAPKPTLQERLTAMQDAELVAFYQGVDARLRAVGEGVRRERADTDATAHSTTFQQTYFYGGEGNRLMNQRRAAERELLRREIPRKAWASPPDEGLSY